MIAFAPRQYRRPATAVAVLVLALSGVACGGDDPTLEGSPGPTATSTPNTGPAESPTPTATASPAASPTGSPPAKLTSPGEAADHLYQAWKRGDRAAAALFAQPAAVDALFARTFTGPDPEFMGCEHEVDHYFCRYRYEGGSTTFRVDGGNSAGYYVTEVTQQAD